MFGVSGRPPREPTNWAPRLSYSRITGFWACPGSWPCWKVWLGRSAESEIAERTTGSSRTMSEYLMVSHLAVKLAGVLLGPHLLDGKEEE